MESVQMNQVVLRCQHVFHQTCIEKLRRDQCPTCRAPIGDESIQKRQRLDHEQEEDTYHEQMAQTILPSFMEHIQKAPKVGSPEFRRAILHVITHVPLSVLRNDDETNLAQYHSLLHGICPYNHIDQLLLMVSLAFQNAGAPYLGAPYASAVASTIPFLCLADEMVWAIVRGALPQEPHDIHGAVILDAIRVAVGGVLINF